MANGQKRWGLLIAPLAAVGLGLSGTEAAAQGPGQVKLFVCKYVTTPGEGERLQTLISVSFNAADAPAVGAFFNDEQGRSFVLAIDEGQEFELSDCPEPGDGEETTTTEDETTTTEGETSTTAGGTTTPPGGGATTTPRGPAVTQTPGAPAPPPGGGSLPTTGPVTDGVAFGGLAALAAGILALLISRRRAV